jgi:hypothetical protein
MTPAEKQLLWHIMASQWGAVTEQGLVKYMTFFKYMDSGWGNRTSQSPRHATDSTTEHNVALDNISIGTYLCDHATTDERKNFEKIMDALKELRTESDKTPPDEAVFQLGPVLKVALRFFT